MKLIKNTCNCNGNIMVNCYDGYDGFYCEIDPENIANYGN